MRSEGCLDACCGMGAVQREAVGMPVPGALAHARDAARRRRRPRRRERRGRRGGAERRLRPARGREREHAHLRRRARLASHVPRARAPRARRRARRASRLALSERQLLGEERSLPRVACRLAATAKRAGDSAASAWASVVDVSQGGLALRSSTTYGGGDLIDVDLDDGTGAVISARVEIVDQTDGLARGPHRRRRRGRRAAARRARRPAAQLAERRRAGARAAARAARGAGRRAPPAGLSRSLRSAPWS